MYKIVCIKTREEGKYDPLPGEESANIDPGMTEMMK